MAFRDTLYKQNKDLWSDFFRTYGELPELWNYGSPLYKDRKRKEKAFNKLLEVYRKLDSTADGEELKRRINIVRSCYRREWKKVMKSRREGETLDDAYVPNLPYYYEVDFLSEAYLSKGPSGGIFKEDEDPLYTPIAQRNMDTKVTADLSNREATDIMENNYYNDYDKYAESGQISEPEKPPESSKRKTISSRVQDPDSDSYFEHTTEMNEENPERESRLVKICKLTKGSLPTTRSFNDETTSEDDAVIFAASWATSYRKLTGMQKIFAKKAIEEILVLGQLEQLSFKTVNMNN